jgi:hypothetical protein
VLDAIRERIEAKARNSERPPRRSQYVPDQDAKLQLQNEINRREVHRGRRDGPVYWGTNVFTAATSDPLRAIGFIVNDKCDVTYYIYKNPTAGNYKDSIEEPTRRMLRRPATVMLHFDSQMIIRFEGRDLAYREIPERPKRAPEVPVVRRKPPKYVPPPTHPWRVPFNRNQSAINERP